MKNVFLKTALIALFTGLLLSSCVNDDFKNPNTGFTTTELVPNKTVQEIATATNATVTQYTTDDIIEAYVTSSDETGNFYNSISFQTIPGPADNPQPVGFSVPVNLKSFVKGFTPGRKVYIKLNGLYRAIVDGSMQIGALYQPNPTDTPKVGRLSETEWQNYLFISATQVPENSFIRTVTLAQAATDANLNTLVEVNNVQFADGSLNRTYYDVDSGGGATNHDITDVATGTTKFFRVSSYAAFAHYNVPSGSGKIRGVMTRYSTDYQFLARVVLKEESWTLDNELPKKSDVFLNNPRLDANPPIGGTALVYGGTMNEPFTSYTTTNQQVFPKYINDAVIGNRYWQLKTFGGNKYVQMSSFGGTPAVNKTAFIVPVDFTAANTLTFKTLSGYDNGSPLKVYYSTDYIPGGDITAATLVNITSSFNIPSGPSAAYASSFTSSGAYPIPAGLTGNGYFIFEYNGNGSGGITTTLELDDIVIN